jgi:hypothetical protein
MLYCCGEGLYSISSVNCSNPSVTIKAEVDLSVKCKEWNGILHLHVVNTMIVHVS